MRLFGPYYYGKRKWDNYLLDIQDTLKVQEATDRRLAKERERGLALAHEEQLAALREQSEQMHRIEDAITSGFEELRAEFEWGFTALADRMEAQIDLLSRIPPRLDAIHNTLQSPLLTQARELFLLGQKHSSMGLLSKALSAYLKAEEKNDVDFPLQFQIGKLYLYGRNAEDNVVDFAKAEEHLLLAARYSNAENGASLEWNEHCGQAYFHAAIAAYLIGEQEQASERLDSMRACLERALGHLNKAARLWPKFTEILYTQAKCHALLGQFDAASEKLEVLSDRDRRYFAKATEDGDFRVLQTEVEVLFRRAIISPGPRARATDAMLEELGKALGWARRGYPTTAEDVATIESSEQFLREARRTLTTLDVDIEALSERVNKIISDVEKIARRALQNQCNIALQHVLAYEERIRGCETSIQELEKTIKETSGAGLGCFFFFLFPALTIGAFNLFFGPKPPDTVVLIGVLLTLSTPFVGVALGSRISRKRQNRPHRAKIEEFRRAIRDCKEAVLPLRERSEAWKYELRNFEEWLSRRAASLPLLT